MRRRGRAAVAAGLWVLVAAGAAAGSGARVTGRCVLSHYRVLEPRALEAVRALRDHYVSERVPSGTDTAACTRGPRGGALVAGGPGVRTLIHNVHRGWVRLHV